MFDLFANLLSTVASFLFPLYASYKALKTSDPASLTPWLMYWVVFGCMMLVESWTYWFFSWIPFYGYFRLGFILYLMLPQTQGARYMYETYLAPYLQENESTIEEFIVNAHEAARTVGLEYIKKAIEYARVQFLGMPPDEPDAPPPPPARSNAQTYTQMLLSRFTIPNAKSASTPSSSTGTSAGDFYNLLASAVSAVSGTAAGPSSSTQNANSSVLSMTSSGALIPPTLRDAHEKMNFITAQRERLSIVLSALEKEAAQLQRQAVRDGTRTPGSDFNDDSDRSALSKSRSETDFVKIDAESGDESGVRRRVNTGGWAPWGWNSGKGGEPKDSGVGQ
ncbi:Receptor expression-enhancing protein 4 [Ceratocystis platani]|uniref:Protein YOP1 n=1 Tax=Ceratocystis fimbriata f. sp. platani TaxID=88771 RepID=A0A0F8D8Y6_CERFI|nr:Receptor expression-enhancing protein 4 [Ceratocystis platani]